MAFAAQDFHSRTTTQLSFYLTSVSEETTSAPAPAPLSGATTAFLLLAGICAEDESSEGFDLLTRGGDLNHYEVLVLGKDHSTSFNAQYNAHMTATTQLSYGAYLTMVQDLPTFDGSSSSLWESGLPVRVRLGTLEMDQQRDIDDHLSCKVDSTQEVEIYALEIFATRRGDPRLGDVVGVADCKPLTAAQLSRQPQLSLTFNVEDNELEEDPQ